MPRKGIALLTFLFILVVLMSAESVFAGFGITPPYVRNTSLTRNSIYEQQILMVRSDPNRALKAVVEIDAPEIQDWIEIVEGTEIQLPKDKTKVAMTVRVTVPGDVDFKRYTGRIRIKTAAPDDEVSSGAVSISLGAQVDVDLNVIDKEIKDFRVRKVVLPDLNEGHKLGWLYFPGKIRFGVLMENTGNVKVSPSKVIFRIYDNTGSVLLEETEHTNKIKKINPFATEQVIAELPTKLPAGSYLARFTIYNDDEIKHDGELNLGILPYGSVQAAGYGFWGLSLPHKVSVVLPIVALLLLIVAVIYSLRRGRRS